MASMIHIAALGSGSRGNAFAFSDGENAILIDAGFSRKELFCRLTGCGIAPESLRAVLLTHEHDDHVKGCRVLCNSLNIPLYATCKTADRLRRQAKLPDRVLEFEAGNRFAVAGFDIVSFPVPHDAVDPVGFVLESQTFRIGVATDLGRVNPQVAARLAGTDVLILESNYDDQLLMASDRSIQLKRRIRGQFGHMNNRDAAAALPQLLGPRTRGLMLVHASSECNRYELVESLATETLTLLRRTDIRFAVVRQDEALPLWTFAAAGAE